MTTGQGEMLCLGQRDQLLSISTKALYKVLQCQICGELMGAPFVLSCGHTFCYDCSYEWLRSHKTCPTCRSKIRQKPVLVYGLRDIHEILVNSTSYQSHVSSVDKNKGKDSLLRVHAKDPFPGLFQDSAASVFGGRLRDNEDHVMRCIRCHWEIEGPECTHCGYTFSHSDQLSESAIDDITEGSVHSQDSEDSYDLDDSFLVPDEEDSTDINGVRDATSDSTDFDSVMSDGHSFVRRRGHHILISSDEGGDEDIEIPNIPVARGPGFIDRMDITSAGCRINEADDYLDNSSFLDASRAEAMEEKEEEENEEEEDGEVEEDDSENESQSSPSSDVEFYGFDDATIHSLPPVARQPRPRRSLRILVEDSDDAW